MLKILCTYKFKTKADRDGFYQGLVDIDMANKVSQEPGNHQFDYFMPCAKDTEILLVETWDNDDCLAPHVKTPHYAQVGEYKVKYGCEVSLEKFYTEG